MSQTVRIAAVIKELTRRREHQGRSKPTEEDATVRVGYFRSPVGADITVDLLIALGDRVHGLVVARCDGFGCVEPVHEIPAGDWALREDHASLMEPMQHKMLVWAQEHAEMCRAVAVPVAHRNIPM